MRLTSQQKSLVSQLGSIMNEDIFGAKPDDPIQVALSEWVESTIEKMKERLSSSGRIASRELYQSIQPLPIVSENGVISASIEMEDYWKYVDQGVNGEKVNRGAPNWSSMQDYSPGTFEEFDKSIKEWIAFKGLGVPLEDMDSVAFAIMKSIRENGMEASYFVTDVVTDESLNDLENRLFELWQ